MGKVISIRFVALVDGYVAGEPVAALRDAIAQCESFGEHPRTLEVINVWSGRVMWRAERQERKLA